MMTPKQGSILALLLASGLAGCQTAATYDNAEVICEQSGLRPGTRSYNRCVRETYAENRTYSTATTTVAIGSGPAVVGGYDPYWGAYPGPYVGSTYSVYYGAGYPYRRYRPYPY